MKLEDPKLLKDSILRESASAVFYEISNQFVAIDTEGTEMGFISIEDWPGHSLGFIQTVFVLSDYRRNGIGQQLISAAEDFAKERGYESVWLRPREIEQGITIDSLTKWYQQLGYELSSDEDHMEKVLSN